MFDYIFYRLYIFYRKKERGRAPISSAVTYLSVLQISLIYFVIMIVNFSLKENISKNLTEETKIIIKIGGVVFALSLDIYNYFYYKRKHKVLIVRFKNHPLNNILKVWMLYFVGAGLFSLPFLYLTILRMF